MSRSLSTLRAYRGHLKGSLTRFAIFAEKITELITLEALETRLEKLDELWEKFRISQEQMYEYVEDDTYIDPETEFEEFENKFLTVKTVFLTSIRSKQNSVPSVTHVDTVHKSTASQVPLDQGTVIANPVDTAATIRPTIIPDLNQSNAQPLSTPPATFPDNYLPKFHIEPFSGNYREWPAFHDMYVSTIHNKDSLSRIQKFHFLRSCLRGESLTLLNHIPVSNATYESAWERLVKRYDRPRYLITSLLEAFMQLPSTSTLNTKGLRKISDGADEVVRGLDSLNSVDRDPWMIYTLLNKVDPETRQAWSTDSLDREYPTIEEFLLFLDRRCEALESCKSTIRDQKPKGVMVRSMHVSSQTQCSKCNSNHLLSQCPAFISMTIEAKRDFVKSKKLCFNCLRNGHNSNRCQSKFRCRTCNSRHHSLVHLGTGDSESCGTRPNLPSSSVYRATSQSKPSTSLQASRLITNHSINGIILPPQTLLPTAIGKVKDCNGHYQYVRMLLDSGSQVSFVTESCMQRLGLRRKNSRIPISRIGSTCAGVSRGQVSMTIVSRFDTTSITVDTYVLSNVTSPLPTVFFDADSWDHILRLDLADPSFNTPNEIDILLGADKVWDILQSETVRSRHGHPLAHKTTFGWVLAGKLTSPIGPTIHSNHTLIDIDRTLQAFWTIEEVNPKSIMSKEDVAIEEHFTQTHCRTEEGRYVVKLPFRFSPRFADTFGGAYSRLKGMEKKFSLNKTLLQSYAAFMQDYLDLGHMSKIPANELGATHAFYLPHHAVFKSDSPTTKLRFVFDGSFKDSQGNSLNDALMVGPPIQRNLFSVCMRFRRHQYVFTADIIKMFRQIRVAEEDTDYQRVIWRKSPNEPLEHYRLGTVTYGTSCAPYLSVRVLEQLAKDHQEEFPVASEILLNDFYVDDVVSGGDSISEAVEKKEKLVELLSKAGLSLSKWRSNCRELLEGDSYTDVNMQSFGSESDSWVKVLGLYWNSHLDAFSFRFKLVNSEGVTKRNILKDVARIFDPLGFIAPSVVQLKILLQELWHKNHDWDDLLPEDIEKKWRQTRDDLHLLTNVNVPHHIGHADHSLQLHGFQMHRHQRTQR